MKLLTQIVAPIVVIVVLVAGVTFIRQYSVTPPPATPAEGGTTPPGEGAVFPLYLPVTIVQWNPEQASQHEADVPGHYDFWFENKLETPVRLGVFQKNCKCSKIEVCSFTQDEGKRYHVWTTAVPAVLSAWGSSPLELITQTQIAEQFLPRALGFAMKWQLLEKDDTRSKSVSVPEKSLGLIRLSWEPKKPSEERLTAEIWSQAQPQDGRPSPAVFQRLEMPISFVPPLAVSPLEVAVGELYPGSTAQAQFVCWSGTQASLPVTVKVLRRDDTPDPCFACTVTPLADAEAQNLSRELRVRVLTGYRITIDIRERISDSVQLDLGPFRRRVSLANDAGKELLTPNLTGVVRGDVSVGTEDDKDRISLGSFRADVGRSKPVILTAERPQVQLSPESIEVEPDFLKAELKSLSPVEGRSRWELTVKVPPGRAAGILPANTAVYLKIQDNPPRRIRIPVAGNAYQ